MCCREEWLHQHRPGGTVTGQASTKPLKQRERTALQQKLSKKLDSVSHSGKKPTKAQQQGSSTTGTPGVRGRGGRGGRGGGKA